jgi:hypothetical protein
MDSMIGCRRSAGGLCMVSEDCWSSLSRTTRSSEGLKRRVNDEHYANWLPNTSPTDHKVSCENEAFLCIRHDDGAIGPWEEFRLTVPWNCTSWRLMKFLVPRLMQVAL